MRHRQLHEPRQSRRHGSSASKWIPSRGGSLKALHPDQDIRIENFRDTRLPEESIDAVVGNVPFADLKLDYHG